MLFSYEVSSEEYDTFVQKTLTEEYQLPNVRLCSSAMSGTQFNGFSLTPNADGDESVYISYLPVESGHVVNNDEPELTESGALVLDRDSDSAWYLPASVVSESPLLPELRQAFHEGESFMEREADYRYHFPDGQTTVAVDAADPVDRPEKTYTITAIESLGGFFPRKWLFETDDGEYLYLRERSGSIRLKQDAGNGAEIFNAYVGGEHPGMNLTDDEILGFIKTLEYIEVVDDPSDTVAEEGHDKYWGDMNEIIEESADIDYDDLIDDEDLDEIIQDLEDDEVETDE